MMAIGSMQAVRLHGREDLRVEEVSIPIAEEHEVQLRVAFTGICGTDLHLYDGWELRGAVTLPPMPAIIGHELSAIVEEVGPGVARWEAGDRVTVQPQVYCGDCTMCQRGSPNMCLDKTKITKGGAWAEYMVANERALFSVPDEVPLSLAAMTEPLGCAMRAVELAEVKPGDDVFVAGGGTIGLLLARLARARGANKIILSEPQARRRRLAPAMGVTRAVDPENEDLEAIITAETGGVGVDIAFEAVGLAVTSMACISAIRPGGTAVLMGVPRPGTKLEIDPWEVVTEERTIKTSWLLVENMESCLRLMPSLGLETIATHTIPLAEASEGIRMCKAGEAVKVLFEVGGENPS